MKRYLIKTSNTQKVVSANSKKGAIKQANIKHYKRARTLKEKADADFLVLDESSKIYFYNYKKLKNKEMETRRNEKI